MIIHFDSEGSVPQLNKYLSLLEEDQNIKGILILACDGNDFTSEETDPVLQSISTPIIGGIFPQIIYGNKNYEKGTIIAGMTDSPEVFAIPGLSDSEVDFEEKLDESVSDISSAQTIMVFVDGLSSRIGDLIDSLFMVFGLEINFLGGGAGSLSFEKKPNLFSNQGLLSDHALIALLPQQSGIGVNHGWKSISGPYKVTESEGNIIKTLDWEPAFEVYKRVVEEASRLQFQGDNFFSIAKGYPFGIKKMGTEVVVRDPIIVQEDGSLTCVGEVAEECYVDILEGDIASLVNAAQQAMLQGLETFPEPAAPQTHILIDCISRVLFMEEKFEQELNAVFDGSTPLIGALTLGEIANTGKDYLEFYNKTAVVGIIKN